MDDVVVVDGGAATDLVRQLSEESERAGNLGDVVADGVADRLSHLEDVEQRQLIGVGFDQFGEAVQHCGSLARVQVRPDAGSKRLAGGEHRGIDVFGRAAGDRCHHAAVGRVDARERAAAGRVPVLPADVGATLGP